MDKGNPVQDIWKSFIRGDDKAFEALFNLYSDIMFRYGNKFINDEDAIKDCIQNVFIKLYDNRSRLPDTDSPKLYLFKALKNTIIDHIRSTRKIVPRIPEDIGFYIDMHYPAEEGEDSDIREKVENILSMLTARQKEAIYLRYQMEMDYNEIAQLLGINYQSVRNLVHRAVEKIRSEMNIMVFISIFLKYFY